MKHHYILPIVLMTALCSYGQTERSASRISTDSRIKQELTDWDPIRGEWLAESFTAMANDEPIPDRTFPEELTPSEMYAMVPAENQRNVSRIINENRQNAPENARSNWDRMSTVVYRPNCALVMGRSYGDPHINSFDGKKFSFQTVGEFVMAKSSDGRFEVQARQKPQSNEISLNTAVAMNVHGDRVGVYASDYPDQISGTPLRVNGQPVFLNNEMFYLPRGGTVQNNGREYIITWPTGEKVQAKLSRTGGMDFMNISVNVYPCGRSYSGILGNANGNSNDDFGDRGTSIASSSVFDPFGDRDFGRSSASMEREYLAFLARDFANQHRVTTLTSLFDYGFGLSTWNYTDESFPRVHLTLADLSQDQRDRARMECERQGIPRDEMSGCVYDLAHANIPPTPRPVITDRTEGRELKPITERVPNVNRPETLTGTAPVGREDGKTPVIQTVDKTPEARTPESGGGTAQPLPTSTTKPAEGQSVGKEVEPNSEPAVVKPQVEKKPVEPQTVTKPVQKPTPQPVSKPEPKPAPTPQPVSKPDPKPVSKPTPRPTAPVSSPKPVSQPKVQTSPKPSPTPVSKPSPVGTVKRRG